MPGHLARFSGSARLRCAQYCAHVWRCEHAHPQNSAFHCELKERSNRNFKSFRAFKASDSSIIFFVENNLDDIVGDRLGDPETDRDVLGVPVPQRTIPVAPGRNLAVLVEAAVREHILRSGGYNATKDLVQKQAEALTQP